MSAVINQTITVTTSFNEEKTLTFGKIVSAGWRVSDGVVDIRVSFWVDEAAFNAGDKAQTRTWIYASPEYPTLEELEAQVEDNQVIILG